MSPRANKSGWFAQAPLILFAFLLLPACSSLGDLQELDPEVRTDNMHQWVGIEAALHVNAPVSAFPLSDDERTLRDLAFPLIEPPYDRQRWDAVIYEYGQTQRVRDEMWTYDKRTYYHHLKGLSTARYNQLMDDINNDAVRIEPFIEAARRVVDIDLRREESMHKISGLNPHDALNARARIGENNFTIAWVRTSLMARCAAYRYALEQLVVSEPEPVAADVDHALTHLQQEIAAYQFPSTKYILAGTVAHHPPIEK